jgi:hypothetical protein
MTTLGHRRLVLEIQDVDELHFDRVLWSPGREMKLQVEMSLRHSTSRALSRSSGVCSTLTPSVVGVAETLLADSA